MSTALRAGVDLGGTKILALIVDGEHAIKGRARHPTPTDGGPAGVAEAIAAAVREAAKDAGVAETEELAGVGVGSPGSVDAEAGTVAEARNLPDWSGSYALGPELQRALGAPVHLGNDVQCAIRAEYALGAGRPYRSVLGVWWGTGLGGGIVIDGELWRGRGAAGEIGHTVVEQGGARCPCGREGCLEAYAGRNAMEARARRKHEAGRKTHLFAIAEKEDKPRLTSGVWEKALAKDDHLAHHLIDRAVAALGTAIGSAVNLLDVEAVILGGGMGERLGAAYHDRLVAATHPHLFREDRPPDLLVTGLPGDGGGLGAAMLTGAAG